MQQVTKTASLVVVGSGGAGMAAAVTAMQKGVTGILVLEKSHFLGGNSRMAGGILYSPETPGQDPAKARDAAFREALEFHHYTRVEPKLLRRFIDSAQETIDWLDASSLRGYPNKYPFGNFYKSIKKMAAQLRAAGNEILTDTHVTAILRNAAGGICAVEAKAEDGTLWRVETPVVMLATGGFTGNAQLLHHYFPDDYDDCFYTDALPQDGDGIALARAAGAALTDYCTIVKENAYSCDSRLDAPNRGAHHAQCLWVNGYGERFHDESKTADETANALVKQPHMLGYALFDQNVLEAIAHAPMGMPFPMGDEGGMPFPMGGEEGMPFPMADLGQQLECEAKRGDGWCARSDTLEGLAGFIGADPAVLRATVEEYNGFCRQGRDGLFAKPPESLTALERGPFYALMFRPILIDTVGPVVVNEKLQVLDRGHRPIPGLYAGGVLTSGWQGVDYHLFGSALCYSLTSGRIAGEGIARQLLAPASNDRKDD